MINNFFDVLKNLTHEKKTENLGSNFYNNYMCCRYLSMNIDYVSFAVLLNRYYDIPKEYQEILLFNLLPKKYVFLKYLKKDSGRNMSEEINELSNKENISLKQAENIINFYYRLKEAENGE